MTLRDKVIDKLKRIYDPEIPVDIYNLGLIYSIDFEKCAKGYYCNLTITFTTPNCPIADYLLYQIHYSISVIKEIYKVNIKVTFDPPWGPESISEEGKEILEADGFF